jgi:preprotein translocase subunit SecF
METNLMKYKYHFFAIPAAFSILALLALFSWGLNPGIDLAGGSLLEVAYTTERPTSDQVKDAAAAAGVHDSRVQPTREN